MISFSFYIPNGKKTERVEGRIENPVKIVENNVKNFKPIFLSEPNKREVSVFNGKNTSFSIVYNK